MVPPRTEGNPSVQTAPPQGGAAVGRHRTLACGSPSEFAAPAPIPSQKAVVRVAACAGAPGALDQSTMSIDPLALFRAVRWVADEPRVFIRIQHIKRGTRCTLLGFTPAVRRVSGLPPSRLHTTLHTITHKGITHLPHTSIGSLRAAPDGWMTDEERFRCGGRRHWPCALLPGSFPHNLRPGLLPEPPAKRCSTVGAAR